MKIGEREFKLPCNYEKDMQSVRDAENTFVCSVRWSENPSALGQFIAESLNLRAEILEEIETALEFFDGTNSDRFISRKALEGIVEKLEKK